MKKSIALLFGALFLFSMANAAVTVTKNGKKTKYENGSAVTVTGAAKVNYNGVQVTVPAKVTVQIAAGTNDTVKVSGENMRDVKVAGNTVNASGKASFSFSAKTNRITVNQGTVQVRNAAGKTAAVSAGASISTGTAEVEAAPAFVNEAVLAENTASQQAVQNAEETLSPSSPR